MTDQTFSRVLVIILNYQTPQMTLRAAQAVLEDMPQGAELLLIDNASRDGSADLLKQEIMARGWDKNGRVRLILSPENGGFGAGNNIGLRSQMSDGTAPDYFYLLNSDAFPDAGCLAALLDHLHKTPQAGMVGSHVRGEDDQDHRTSFRFPSIAGEFEGAARLGPVTRLLHRAVVAPELPTSATAVDWTAGASLLIRAQVLAECGFFDERFFLYFEETDLCKRAGAAGWQTWYLPKARTVHIGSVSTGMKEWDRVPAYWFRSRSHYFIKHHGRGYAAAALVARLAGGGLHALRSLLKAEPRQDPPGFYRDLLRHGLGLPLTGETRQQRPGMAKEQR